MNTETFETAIRNDLWYYRNTIHHGACLRARELDAPYLVDAPQMDYWRFEHVDSDVTPEPVPGFEEIGYEETCPECGDLLANIPGEVR